MKNWNIIYKAELSNETTLLAFKQLKTNRLKYKLINTKYKTPAEIGLIELRPLPDAYQEVQELDGELDSFITNTPTYGTRNGVTIVKSIRYV